MPSPDPTEKSSLDWLAVLRTVWAEQNLDRELETALFHYLADLKVFEETDADLWHLSGDVDTSSGIEVTMRHVLEDKAQTEPGFALAYFLPGSPEVESVRLLVPLPKKAIRSLKLM